MTTTIEDDGLRAAEQWRNLALQFDGHRIEALEYLRTIVHSIEQYATVRDILREPLASLKVFLASPPLSGEAVLAERLAALRSSPAVDGVGEPVAWICDGCGRVFKDPAGDLHALRVSGALSCCPERKPIPLYTRSAISPTSDRASVVEDGSAGRPTEEEMERAYDRWCEMPSIMSTRDRLRLALTAALSPRSS